MLAIISSMFSPLYLLLLLVPVLYLWLRHRGVQQRASFKVRHGVPYYDHPSIFQTLSGKVNLDKFKLDSLKTVGKVYGFKLLQKDTILVAVPELIQTVMSKEFTNFTNRRTIQFSDPIFKHFLSVTTDETWKRQRAIITPTFATGKLRLMMPRVRITLQTLLDNVDEAITAGEDELRKTGLNMKKLANAFTMDTIAQTAFGMEMDSLKDPNNEILKNGQKLFATDITWGQIARFMIFFAFPRISEWFKLEFNPDVNRFFSALVKKALVGKRQLVRQQSANFRPTNFIELLLEAEAEFEKQSANAGKEEDSNKKISKFMSNDEIISQCVLFFLAGFETTASTIALTVHELAMNEDIQDKLYDEIETVLASLEGNTKDDPIETVDFEHLNKFEYLSAVVNETLRLHPPATITEREAAKDIKLATADGTHSVDIFKDDIIQVPIYAIHYDEDNFPEPELFQPERFLQPTHHNYAYLPFGQGPRNCVAKSFALMEVKLTVLHLVHRYKFTKCEATKHPVEIYNQNNLNTPKAVPLKVEKRA